MHRHSRTRAGLLFPSPTGRTLSNATISKLLREQGVAAVPHGFRSSFRDWAAECTDAPHEVCEIALAHVNSDRVEAAYCPTDLLERRRQLMADWARYIPDLRERLRSPHQRLLQAGSEPVSPSVHGHRRYLRDPCHRPSWPPSTRAPKAPASRLRDNGCLLGRIRPSLRRSRGRSHTFSPLARRLGSGLMPARTFIAIRSVEIYSLLGGRQPDIRSPIENHGLGRTEEHPARNGGQTTAAPPWIPLRTTPARPPWASRPRLRTTAQGSVRPWLFLARPRLSQGSATREPHRLLEPQDRQQ